MQHLSGNVCKDPGVWRICKKKDLDGTSYVGTIQHMVITRTQEECVE